ncbi:PDZ domain-containing protein [Rubritalea tangerina]|uniref:PDZ domain-containing protein n=1 Tax=Rubritalea tangerina TaxID=430798 RepID=A0ABW4ZBH1_9BACT
MKLIPRLIASHLMVASVGVLGAQSAASLPKAPVGESVEQSRQIEKAIAEVYPALVRVHVVMEQPKDGRMQKGQGSGSGTIIHPDGYVLTNHHVAGDGSRVWVRLSNKLKVDAEVVGTDPQTDLCVLKLNMDQIPESMKPLAVGKFGDFSTLEVGEPVLAMGSPAGVSQSVTLGVVANLEMITPNGMGALKQAGETVGDLVRWIGHDAVIYFGNSGGPLVNLRGEIIGVNEIGLGSLGGAIPADIAEYVAKELIEHGEVRRSWIGLYPQPVLKSAEFQDGVLAAAVVEGSPAAEAGLQPGDVVTHIDGHAVKATAREHLPLFNRVILGTPVGKSIKVGYRRDGKACEAVVVTEERSKAKADDRALREWGITARNLTKRSALRRNLDTTEGVFVSTISKSGPAASAKPAIKPGDRITSVDGKEVASVEEFGSVTKALLEGCESREAIVEFERGNELLATVVKVGKKPNESHSAAASHAWLGVKTQVLTKELARALNLTGKKGVRVTRVHKGSSAEASGLQKGDVILKVDGAVVAASQERDAKVFEAMVREYDEDAEVQLVVVRGGEELEIECALESSPKKSSEFRKLTNDTFEFTLRELSKANPDEAEVGKGVLVEGLERAGWAALAGLKGGDVIQSINGKLVDSLESIEAELEKIEREQVAHVVLFVKRAKFSRYIEIQPIWQDTDV